MKLAAIPHFKYSINLYHFGSGPYFERPVLFWKAHSKSHGLFPFVEMIENYGNVSVPLKGLVETGI